MKAILTAAERRFAETGHYKGQPSPAYRTTAEIRQLRRTLVKYRHALGRPGLQPPCRPTRPLRAVYLVSGRIMTP